VALTVLRLLALHAGAPVHRDVIIAHQWSGLPEAAALHNLHVCVSNLRAGFEAAVPGLARTLLVRRGHAYLLAPGGEPLTDLQRVDAHLRNAAACRRAGDRLGEVEALRSAVELYAGEVLPGDGTAEWVVAARDREQLRAAGAAARLAVVELGRSRTEAAVSAAQRSVQIDPWRDASWQLLISVHERAGQPAAAERARKDYAAVLRSLGVTPMAVLPRAAPARRRSTREARRHGVGSAADVRTG
jgi:DNA-binding SARP family transcriptional activator